MRHSLFIIFAVLVAGTLGTWLVIVRADRELRQDLIQQAGRVVQTMNLDHVKALTGTADDLVSPAYQRLKQQFILARQVTPKCRFLYLLGRRADGKFFFHIDSETTTSKDYSPPGQAFEEPSEELRGIFVTREAFVEGPVSDRWGTWFSALVPLINPSTGKLIAVFGMDIDARDWNATRRHLALPPALFTLALILILFAGNSLLARRAGITSRSPRWMQHIELAMTVAVGLTLTLCTIWITHDHSSHLKQNEFSHLAKGRIDAVIETFRHIGDTELESVARFCENQEHISPEEFRLFTAYLVNNPVVQAWEWIPVVPAIDKSHIEAEAREGGLASFAIWQKADQGKRQPVAGRELYYPVLLAAPLAGNEPVLGYDLGSEPLRRAALEAAAQTGLPTTTAPITLIQETAHQKGLLICRPVFSRDEPKRLRGFAVAVLRMGSLLKRVAPEETPYLPHVELVLLRPTAAPEELANTYGARWRPDGKIALTMPLFFFDKTIAVMIHASPGFLRAHSLTSEWLALLAGLAITLAFTKWIHTMLHGREALQQAVHDRTVALRESEEWLAATLRSIGDGVIATDAGGRVTNLNAVAERLTGWTIAEAAGRSIEDIFRIVHAKTRATVENPVGQVLLAGVGVNLANHTVLITRDGAEYQIADSCAPILDANGNVLGAVLVVRDVTEEYAQREQLRNSEAKYRLLVDHSSDLIWNLNEDGVFTYVSPSWQRVTGYAPEAIIGTTLESLIHPDDFPVCRGYLQRMVQFDETLASLEFRIRHADNSWRWHAVNISLVVGSGNHPFAAPGAVPFTSLVGVSRDITDRKKTETQLQESESLQRLLLDSIDAGVVIIDATTHTIERVNRKGAELFGVAENQILGHVCHRFICPAEVGRCPITDLGQEVNNSERVLVRVDGSHLPVLKSARRIRIDSQEKILGTFIDISARKRAEEALQYATERLSLAVRAGGVGIWGYDVVNNQLTWDDQMFRLYGITPDQFGGAYEAWQAMIHPDDRQRSDAEIQFALKGEKDFDTEFRMVWPDGTTHNIRALATVQRDAAGRPQHMIGTNWDITAQKQGEANVRRQAGLIKSLLDSSPDIIFFKDINGVLLDCNLPFAEFIGRPREEIIGKTDYDLVDPKMADIFKENDLRMMRQREAHRNEEWITYPNGRKVLLDTLKTPYWGPDGQLIGILGISRDITARQKAGDALRESEANFRTFFETVDDMIIVASPDGQILFSNAAMKRKLGYNEADLGLMHILDIYLAGRRQEAGKTFAAMLDGGQKTCLLSVAAKDGALIPAETRVWRGRWNGMDCIFSASKDLSAEQEALERFERLFRNNPALMALSTMPERVLLDVNNAFLKTLGYTKSEVMGKTAADLGLLLQPEQQATMTEQLSAHGHISDLELNLRRKDGGILTGIFSGEVISSQGKQYLLTVMIDITARKEMEKQLRKYATMEMLMAAVSARFINLAPSETDDTIQQSLSEVGALVEVDRAYTYIFCPDYSSVSNTHEWCSAGTEPQIGNQQNESTENLRWWMAAMRKFQNIVIPDVSKMPPEAALEKALLEAQGILSLLVVPMVWGGRLEGFIGFDAVKKRHDWNENEVAPLELLASIIINGLKRKETEEHLQATQQTLREVNATLERRVDQRTRQLQQAQSQLFLQDKMSSIGQLAAGMAHEINNPIGFISTNFATLEEDVRIIRELLEDYQGLIATLEPTASAFQDRIAKLRAKEKEVAMNFMLDDLPNLFAESRDGFRRVTAIINSMRNFARRDAVGEFTPFNLNKGVEDTLTLAHNAYKYNAEIKLELGELPDIPCVPGQINQVLLNLIVNAAQALASMPDHGGGRSRITIRTWNEATGVVCEVEDNGPGIPDGLAAQIFDPFFTTKPPGEGTGLGLSISYNIVVAKHGGTLTVANVPGSGACFRMTLPHNPQAADAAERLEDNGT